MVLDAFLEALVIVSGLYEHYVALNHMSALVNLKCPSLALNFTFHLGISCLKLELYSYFKRHRSTF